jgi:hypothetical protein
VSSANRAGHPRQQGKNDGLNFPAFPCRSGKKIEFDTQFDQAFPRIFQYYQTFTDPIPVKSVHTLRETAGRQAGTNLFVASELGIKDEAYTRILAPTWRQRGRPGLLCLDRFFSAGLLFAGA